MEKTSTSSCIYDEANFANDSDVKIQGQSLNAWAAMLVLYLSRTGEHHKLCPLLEWKQAEILHLENDSNDAMRAGAASALGIAASSNEPFMNQSWEAYIHVKVHSVVRAFMQHAACRSPKLRSCSGRKGPPQDQHFHGQQPAAGSLL